MIFLPSLLHFALVSADAPKNAEAAPAQPPAGVSEVAPMAIDPLQYTYNPFGKRDPFRSFLLDRVMDKSSSADPLLNYDLSKFTLTGILWGVSNPKAIVKDGDGRGHIISRGTRIGRNKGQVVRILKEELVVAEEYRDPLGKLMVSEYSMKLEKEGTKK
ncbi:MAG: pilus assembly protein PilP [Deltaproteobacteria bacterium]|nr:pilus assembly protein PilP [Deltaproteobacteria bacterium]